MTDYSKGSDPDGTGYYLITCDEYIEKFADELRSSGCSVTGEMMEPAVSAAEPFRSCVLRIVDQYGAPVPGAAVRFCTDSACTMQKSGADGAVSFSGSPDAYQAASGAWRLQV